MMQVCYLDSSQRISTAKDSSSSFAYFDERVFTGVRDVSTGSDNGPGMGARCLNCGFHVDDQVDVSKMRAARKCNERKST